MTTAAALSRREAAILAERTRRLAAPRSGDERARPRRPDLLVFAAGGERFGLPLRAVAAVLAARAPLPVPGAPPAMLGLIGEAGEVLALFDAAAVLGATGGDRRPGRHIVILAGRPPAALLVERALGIATADSPAPPPEEIAGAGLVSAVARAAAGQLDRGELAFSVLAPDRLRHRLAPPSDRPGP